MNRFITMDPNYLVGIKYYNNKLEKESIKYLELGRKNKDRECIIFLGKIYKINDQEKYIECCKEGYMYHGICLK
jgi:hypothetical protein